MRIKGRGTLATPALALFAVVAVGVAVLPVSAKAATQSDSIYLGKWCGSGTLEVTSLSPPAGSYVPFPNAFPDDVQGIAGPAAIIVGDGSLSFRPTGTSRVFSLTLSDGVLSGTLDSNHRHYSIMFKKCRAGCRSKSEGDVSMRHESIVRLRLLFPLLVSVALPSCAPSYPVLTMNAEQLKSESDDAICGTMTCSAHVTNAMSVEMKRRNLSCLNITYACTSFDPSERATPAIRQASAGPPIRNINSPACAGISIAEAGIGNYNGIIPAVYVKVRNNSGERKWIQADIKYGGETHTALQDTPEQWWRQRSR